MTGARVAAVLLVVVAIGSLAFVFWPRAAADVTLYCSVDQDHSLAIVEDFERESGLEVRFQGDTEANKSVGLAQRLLQERGNPAADVFWANEPMNTVALDQAGVLAPLPAGVADDFPQAWRDPDGRYVAYAARARVILVNRELLPDESEWPTSVEDLLDPKWTEGRGACLARPLTGTTFTHAAVLLTADEAKGRDFWTKVAAREGKGLKLAAGNAGVMRQVSDARNKIAWGLTDTDDAKIAVDAGDPVSVVYPDQADGRPGTLVIPNTVSLVRAGPHPAAGERLLRFLVSRDVERRLAEGPSAQVPVRDGVPAPAHVRRPGKDFRAMAVDWRKVGTDRERWLPFLQTLFQK